MILQSNFGIEQAQENRNRRPPRKNRCYGFTIYFTQNIIKKLKHVWLPVYRAYPNFSSRPLLLEWLYVKDSLSVRGKLESCCSLHIGQLYSISELLVSSLKYFLSRQVTVHIHLSHTKNIFSLLLGLLALPPIWDLLILVSPVPWLNRIKLSRIYFII